jgi:hypothetical protein
MAASMTDQRLARIIDKQLELAEAGDRKAAEFVIKMCGGGSAPQTFVQNNYYGEAGQPKTPLGNRVKNYLKKHGATKPVILATELEADVEEVERELARGRFAKSTDGWVVA